MSFTDKTLTCRDCGASFTFTASEQEFYSSKGFSNEPGRCPPCRTARKRAKDGGSGGGGGFGGGGFGGGGSFGGGGGGYERRDRQLFSVVCAECGKQTEVPFQPRGDRPVYCSDCFQSQRGGGGGGGGRGGGGGGRSGRW
ncbi:hypothetical protein DYH09_01600 [bacterium CPR1]|nr:hypothetical protein [bacterium CPR1]